MLRGLRDAQAVAQTLAAALKQAEAARHALPLRAVGTVDARTGVPTLVARPLAHAA
jgi:predicted pyridoxine 5'-phosphate oxidase superfamily flavin-nucleotide-binding protein